MKKIYPVFIELIPEFIKEIQTVIKSIEKYDFKCLLMIEEPYTSNKRTYRDVVLTIDDTFIDNFIYVGMFERIEHEFKYIVYNHENEDLLLSLSGNYDCELCHVDRERKEMHVALIDSEPKLFGSSCIQKFLPDVWRKIKYFQQFTKDLKSLDDFIEHKMANYTNFDILHKVDIFCLTLSKINEVGYNYFDKLRDTTQQLVADVIRWAMFTEQDLLDRTNYDYDIDEMKQKVLSSKIELENARKNYESFYEQFVQFVEHDKENIDLTSYSTICENKSDYTCFAHKVVYLTYRFNEKYIVVPRFNERMKTFINKEKRVFSAGDSVKEDAMVIRVSNTIPVDNFYKRCVEYIVFITIILKDGTLCSFKTSSPYIIDNINAYKKGTIINAKFTMSEFIQKDKYNFDMDTWKVKVSFRKSPLV